MPILGILTFVGALWIGYIAVLYRNFDKISKIYKSMLKSWTGAKPATNDTITVKGAEYVRFSLGNYKEVPQVFRITRRHYAIYSTILLIGCFLFLVFIGLGLYAAYVSWETISSKYTQVPEEQARILIAGNILVLFVSIGLWPFIRYFENTYIEHYYTINENGQRVSAPAEAAQSA